MHASYVKTLTGDAARLGLSACRSTMSPSHLVLFLAILFSIVVEVYPRSAGAPAAACEDIMPLGHISPGQSSQDIASIPYPLDISAFNVDGGQAYEPGMTYISESNTTPGMVSPHPPMAMHT